MLIDIIFGILLAIVISAISTHRAPGLELISLGVIGALLPDIDFVIWLIRKRGVVDKWAHKHRDLLHYPLLLIPAAFLITNYFFDNEAAWLVSLATLAHFIHDTVGIGGGIRWLWPFDKCFYYLEYSPTKPLQLHRWTTQEQDAIAHERGNPHWIRDMYPPRTLAIQIGAVLLLLLALYWLQ